MHITYDPRSKSERTLVGDINSLVEEAEAEADEIEEAVEAGRQGEAEQLMLDSEAAMDDRLPVASTIVDPLSLPASLPDTVGPPSRYTDTASPSAATACSRVVAAGWPVRLADDTASGPVSERSSRAISLSGIRNATVP